MMKKIVISRKKNLKRQGETDEQERKESRTQNWMRPSFCIASRLSLKKSYNQSTGMSLFTFLQPISA